MNLLSTLNALRFEAVSYDYGRRRVLNRVSFQCRPGSITGVLGPNGAGKTTLLAVAAMRARPSAGSVHYGDRIAHPGNVATRRCIGWLGHDPGLYPELSAKENLRFFGQLHGTDVEADRIESALRLAGLVERADDPVGSLSRGMRQRVGLERVLLPEPGIVLLDEPFTGLDARSAHALVDRLDALRQRGCVVLVSTHDVALVGELVDASVVLRVGRVVACLGPTTNLADAVRDALEGGREGGRDFSPAVEDSGPTVPAKPVVDAEPGFGGALRQFARATVVVAKKDLLVEYRSRELFITTLFFAVSAVLVFAFAFVRDGRALPDAAAGILWVALAFAGTLALGRTFDREHAHQTLPALLHAPVEASAIYVGKLLALLALMLFIGVVLVPLIGLLFQASILDHPIWIASLLVSGVLGLLAVGSVFAAMLVRSRSRDVLLPVLLYPMTVPVLIAGVRGTAALTQPVPDVPTARMWLGMLVAFDLVFVTLALWTFESVTTE